MAYTEEPATQLEIEHMTSVISSLPEEVKHIMRNHKLYLGGGYVRSIIEGEAPNDIDLFIESAEDATAASAYLRDNCGYSLYTTENAITCQHKGKTKVQLITRWKYGGKLGDYCRSSIVQQMLDSFDYTICQAVVYHESGLGFTSRIASGFYDALYDKQMVYTHPKREEEPAGSLLRLVKFLKRGYSCSDAVLAHVIGRCCGKLANHPHHLSYWNADELEVDISNGVLGLIDNVRSRSQGHGELY